MNKSLIFFFAVTLFHQFTFGQWVEQPSGSNLTKYNVRFVDENTGWVTGTNSLILKTTNSGTNWFQQSGSIPSGRELNGLQMLNANTGFVIGWNNTVIKTTNGGINWSPLNGPSPVNGSHNGLSFVNENTGWICSFLGTVWKTTNGGTSWDSLSTGSSGALRDIEFVNDLTGWVVGDVGYMRKTTDGGANWFFQFFGTFADYYYNSLQFINENTGWVVGYNDKVFRTTNGGSNWDLASNTPGICIHFVNSMTGWTAGDNGDMYKSTDGGLNFNLQTIPAMGGFFTDIDFVNDTTGWSIDVFIILKTTNGGGEFVGINTLNSNVPDDYALFQNYPNPFNPSTTIEFEIPFSGPTKLVVYDLMGREVETIINRKLVAGSYKVFFNGDKISSGIYFYSLVSSNTLLTRKMSLIK